MATLGGLIDNLAILLARDDITGSLSATAKLAITRAISHYESEQFWFTEGRASFSATTGVSEYTLSASMLTVIQATITKSGDTYPIYPIPESERLGYSSSNLTGSPTWFAVFGNRFIPYPAPNDAYAVHLAGVRRLSTLSASTDSNAWTVHAEELIESRAAWWLCQYVFKTHDEAQTFKALEANALDSLRGKMADKIPSRVTPTKF